MRGLLRIEADDPEGVIRQRIEAWVAAHDLNAEVIPYLGSLFALRDERLLYLQDEERYQGLRDAALSVLRAVTANGPLLIVLEDLHWIDASSRRLLDDLVEQAGSLPLLLCCVYRPEFQHEWEGTPTYRTMLIEPLSREHTVALSESIVKLDMPPELEHAILSRAEGNPFFIEEMLKALMDEGVIARTRIGYELRRDVSQVNLPPTMQGVIMARIDRLEAQARETLQVASVIGRRFSETLLKAVSPRSQRVEQDLEQLQGLDLVYQHSILPDLEYIFKHFVTREVAYNSILIKRRKAIHLEIARAMERIYRDRLEEYYEALAHHFEAGEEWQKAADYFGKAGTKARELHSDAGATAFMERRDQAVQKVFEQKEGTSQYRYILIAGPLVAFFCYELFKMSLGLFPRNWMGWVAQPLLLLLWMGGVLKFIRARVADSLTIYSDRLLIRGRKDITQIYFQTIASVQLFRQRRYRMNRKEQIVFGASGYWTAFRERYFGVGNVIRMTRRTEKPVILHSLNSGEVYRELKLSMTQWAVAQKIDIAGTLTGSHSMCEEQYHLPLRQVDGIHLPAVTYDQLVDKIVKGEVEKKDEVFVREKRARDPVWVSLETAAQEDSRLWAALHPVCHSLIACCYHPWFSIAILLLVLAAFLTIGRRPGGDITHFGNILLLGSGSILFILMGMHLRFGFLEWTKRYALSRWQQIGLRVVTGGAVAAIVYGLIRLNLLAW